jgi:hypothetical protein
MNRRTAIVALVVALCLRATPAFGAIIIAGPVALVPVLVVPPDGDTVRLNPNPVTYLAAATPAMRASLAAEFPGFNFIYHAGGLSGTLTINRYVATSLGPHNGGAIFEARYTRAATDPALADLRFIQLVDTNAPLGGATSPYIDPRPNDDTLPFYYTTPEDTIPAANGQDQLGGDKGSGTYRFWDRSLRDCRSHPDFITWRGELILASFVDDGVNRNVDVYDGVRWGWDFTCVPAPSSLVSVLTGVFGLGACHVARKRWRCGGRGGDDRTQPAYRNKGLSVPPPRGDVV